MPEILINVINKIPQLSGDVRQITADNTDYRIRFVFDDDWSEGEKTVFFVREGGFAYPFAITENDEADVPAVMGVHIRTSLFVGVQQGDVKTSRPCMIPVYHAITDMIDDSAVQPEPTMWEGIVQRIMELEMAKLSPVAADAGMSKPVGVTEDGQLMTAPDVFWVQYGVTKYADIKAAVDAGKLCVLRSNNDTAVLASGKFAEFFDFLGDRYLNTRVLYRLNPDDSWTTQNYSIITEHDRTSAITPDSAGRMIPTDKAVYNAILKYATGGTGGSGTDLYGSAMVTIAGPDYDNLAVESIVFPPGVTEAADQNKLLAACAVKCFLMVAASEDDLTMGTLDCGECVIDEESGGVSLSFMGPVVGRDAVTLLGVTTDFESVIAIPQIVSHGGGSGGGSCESGWTEILPETTAVNDDPDAVGVELPGMDEVAAGDVCRVYWNGKRYSAEAVVTAVDGELSGIPVVTLTNRVSDETPGFSIMYIPSAGGAYALDTQGSSQITVRVEKRGDCVGWEEFEELSAEVAGKVGTQELNSAVNYALAQAKESGEFDGEPGQPGTTPHIGANGNWYIGDTDTGVKAQGNPGEPGQPGAPGDDYVLTDDDKTEIAQEAAGLIDTALLSIIGEVE